MGGQFLGSSAEVLELPATTGSFNCATVTLDGKADAFVNPAQRTFAFGPKDRGKMALIQNPAIHPCICTVTVLMSRYSAVRIHRALTGVRKTKWFTNDAASLPARKG